MNNVVKNRQRGLKWQRDLLRYLRVENQDAEPIPQAGQFDESDLVVRLPNKKYIAIEAKCPGDDGPIELGPWMGEAEREARNFADARMLTYEAVRPLLIIKAYGQPAGQAFCVVRLDDYLRRYT